MNMKKWVRYLVAGCLATGLATVMATTAWAASPSQDRTAMRTYFENRFPSVPLDELVHGANALDPALKAQWEQIMQFPPYFFAVSTGETLFNAPLPDGSHYADCFDKGGIGITQTYPRFDTQTGRVVTLESAINACRVKHGDKPLPWGKGDIAAIAAYMTKTSRKKSFDVKVPNDPRALAAYENGKRIFYSRRGQLNFSCASCHVQEAGKHLRAQVVSPALGMVAAFPVYRSKWGEMGTLQRRFAGCFVKVRAKAPPLQSKALRDLEYFLTYMSNGMPVVGPGARP